MIFDPSSLLTEEELITPRSPMALAVWVENKCRAFARNDEAKKWVLLHEGLSKKFHEEVYPLSLLAAHLYSGRHDIHCIPNIDDKKDFDAVIIDYSTSPASELKFEFTSATDDYEQHLRMKYFLEHDQVNVYGKLLVSGTKKTGRKIQVENEMVNHKDLLQRTFSSIKDRAERKSTIPGKLKKYGTEYVLVIVFDDWLWFNTDRDRVALENFVKKEILTLPLNFASLYILGLSGKTFLHFKINKT
jgi:hypothetical protein